MDNQMMFQMLLGMIDRMSDKEIDAALVRVKELVSPQDFEKISAIVAEKRKK